MAALQDYQEVEKAVLFGSRAKGNYRKGSDIDLAITGKNVSAVIALNLKAYLNEVLPIPYYVDVVAYNLLDQPDLKEHIDRVGISFYQK
ncbi:nucleotidyltransferase family protein [Mucilaginibacter sp.]|uniref:nucleotidyltransferase family protein n=1 Tax=Mucilaginibacter sp. TaxID=1882438 RepID=UPI003B006865